MYDKILGGIFGILKGVFLSMVMMLILIAFLPPGHPILAQSRLTPYIMAVGKISTSLLPEDLEKKVLEKKEALAPYWNHLPQNNIKERK